MRFCNRCRKLTLGEPLFCNHCGSSFDEKLCPARHVNARYATACRECGSREFSTPAPPISLGMKLGLALASWMPGVFLGLLLLMVAVAIIQTILTDQQVQSSLVALLFILSVLFYAYTHLPGFLKSLIKKPFQGKSGKSTHKHH